jgi:hypothetical protein
MFYNGYRVFLRVIQMHFSSISSAFRCMLKELRLDVSKVHRVLHIPPHFLLHRLGFSSSLRRLGMRRLLPLFSMLVAFETVQILRGRMKRGGKQTTGASDRTLASQKKKPI